MAGALLLLGYVLLQSTGGPRGAPRDPSRAAQLTDAAQANAAAEPGTNGARDSGAPGPPTRQQAVASGSGSARESAPEQVAPPLLRRADRGGRPERYQGRGRVRGSLVVRGNVELPDAWRLVLSPSLFLAGRQHAVRRVLEFDAGPVEFAVEDLPFGAYDLRVEAAGWNSVVQPVDLHDKNRDPYVTLALTPGGFVDGQVTEAEGDPLPELAVTLTPLPNQPQLASVEPRTVLTDALGGYRFDTVVDGDYQLSFGRVVPPPLPLRRITFEAPSMRVPTLAAPPRPALLVTVVDAAGFAVADALVVVDGRNSRASGTTGPDGRLRIALLGAGENQIAAKHADHGNAVRVLELPASGLVTARLELAR